MVYGLAEPPSICARFARQPFHNRLATVLSVHNAGFQGHAAAETMARLGLPAELYDWRWLSALPKVETEQSFGAGAAGPNQAGVSRAQPARARGSAPLRPET